jgi:hypothetical protein
MPGNINSDAAELLHEPPHFRPPGSQLSGNFRPAYYYGRVIHEQANNLPKALVGFLGLRRVMLGGRASSGCPRP